MRATTLALMTLGAGICLSVSVGWGEVRVPQVFGDHMVLQRDREIPVWGTADPEEMVTVVLGNLRGSAVAGRDGRWKVKLGKLPAGGPYEMTIAGKNTITLRDVLIGEVWVCSGQSNMWWTMDRMKGVDSVIAAARFPNLRLFSVWSPEHDSFGKPFEWTECTPESVLEFSAVAFFFGREIHREMGVPVGLIHTSMGGSVPEAWMTRKALVGDSASRPITAFWDSLIAENPGALDRFQTYLDQLVVSKRDSGPEPGDPGLSFVPRPLRFYMRYPEGIRRKQLEPILGYGIRGVVWYQGESSISRSAQYRSLFPAMIREWRHDWGQGNFPFVYAQIANYKSNPLQVPELREAQRGTLDVKNTAMAVTADIGDENDVHFNNKWDTGRRLALAALGTVYDREIVYSGPLYRSMRVERNAIRIRFDHVGGGLEVRGGELTGFEIAGADRVFHPAEARISGREVVVVSPEVSQPKAVRYGWSDIPKLRLYNTAGLPASPFRTDTWPWVTEDAFTPDPFK